jgi:hypothetical protein
VHSTGGTGWWLLLPVREQRSDARVGDCSSSSSSGDGGGNYDCSGGSGCDGDDDAGGSGSGGELLPP